MPRTLRARENARQLFVALELYLQIGARVTPRVSPFPPSRKISLSNALPESSWETRASLPFVRGAQSFAAAKPTVAASCQNPSSRRRGSSGERGTFLRAAGREHQAPRDFVPLK